MAGGSVGVPSEAVFDSIGNWMFEHMLWTSGDYSWGGHYAEIIDPGNKCCGMAAFIPKGSKAYTGIGVFSGNEPSNEAQIGVKGRYLQKIEVLPSKMSVKSSQSVNIDKGKTTRIYLKATSKYTNETNTAEEKEFYEETEVYLMSASDWKSKNPSIATVDASGSVKGIKEGTAKLTAKRRGKEYTVTVNVVDVKKATPAKVKIKKPKGGKAKFTVKWKKAAKAKGYQINVKDGKGNDCGTLNIKKGKKKTLSKTFYGVPKGTYKVRVRAFNKVKGQKYYGSWSKFKTVKVH